MISLFSTSLIIAFKMRFLEKLEVMECFFDTVMVIDIILVFFTAVELPPTRRKSNEHEKPSILKDKKKEKEVMVDRDFSRYEYNMIKIAKTYLLRFLVFDLLACMPTLITLNHNKTVYLLKLFKFLQIIRIYEQIQILKLVLIKRAQHH